MRASDRQRYASKEGHRKDAVEGAKFAERRPVVEAEIEQTEKICHDLVRGARTSIPVDEGRRASVGTDSIITSRYRIGGAVAAAIAAEAIRYPEDLERSRTGQAQDIDGRFAPARVVALYCAHMFSRRLRNGHRLELFPRSSFAEQDFYPTKDDRRMFILRTQLYPENISADRSTFSVAPMIRSPSRLPWNDGTRSIWRTRSPNAVKVIGASRAHA